MKVEIELEIFEQAKNFFLADFGEVVGIYHDGEKIFLARLTDKLETLEQNFEIDSAENISAIEQLAEKISVLCSQRGWKTSKTALCLQEGDTIIFQPDFNNIPAEKIDSAVKIWATAQVGENALYTSATIDGEFFTEAIAEKVAAEYISAWEKNSMTLCAMSSLAGNVEDKASFIAKIAAEKKSPNLLKYQDSKWDWKKIFAAVFGIFFLLTAPILGKTYYELQSLQKNFEVLQEKLSDKAEFIDQEKNIDADIEQLQIVNEFLASQLETFPKLNTLIKIGKLSDGKISLKRIIISGNTAELEGTTTKAEEIKNYLNRLKNSITKNANLENISSEDGQVNFTIRLIFAK